MFQKFQEKEQTHRRPHSFIQCHRKKKKKMDGMDIDDYSRVC